MRLGHALLFEGKNIFDRALELLSNQKREPKRGDVVAFFHRTDGLTAGPYGFRQFFLGEIGAFA